MGRTRFSGPIKSTDGFEIGPVGTNTPIIDSSGNLYQAGTLITATAAELNQLDDNILSDMTPGTGISTGTGTICEHSIIKVGGIFKTEILIDLTGLNGCGANGDIIGKDGGTANCHIGQITAAVNGTIIAGLVECHEAPAGGNADIDIYSATVGTGVQDTAIGDLTETALANCGAHSAGSSDYFTAWPATNAYLYLTVGTFTDADYTAGRLLITFWGI
ncbi:hypothetical protein KAX02_03005 [candidate division WOR-3 bacterium]|nr:hypothetical protein [candidate division WOR-3 bacterium]